MPTKVNLYGIGELAHKESPNMIMIKAAGVRLNILEVKDCTVVSFPFGTKFDIINGEIIIHKTT